MILSSFNLTVADRTGTGPDRRSLWCNLKDWLK